MGVVNMALGHSDLYDVFRLSQGFGVIWVYREPVLTLLYGFL